MSTREPSPGAEFSALLSRFPAGIVALASLSCAGRAATQARDRELAAKVLGAATFVADGRRV